MSKIISCLPALYSSASPVSCLFGTQDICQDFFVSNLCLSLDKVMFKVMHKQYYINQAPKSPAKSSLQRSTQAGSTLRIRRPSPMGWVQVKTNERPPPSPQPANHHGTSGSGGRRSVASTKRPGTSKLSAVEDTAPPKSWAKSCFPM